MLSGGDDGGEEQMKGETEERPNILRWTMKDFRLLVIQNERRGLDDGDQPLVKIATCKNGFGFTL